MSSLKASRRTVQAAFAVGLPVVAWFNAHNWEHLSGNLLAFSVFGYPLADPLAAIQVCLGSLALPWKSVVGGASALALAFALGPVFCSWACPFGLLSELVASRRKGPPPMGRPGYRSKGLAVAGMAAVLALLGAGPLLNHLSLPGWYTRAFQVWFNQQELAAAGIALLAAALGAEALSGKRLWCRYVCPQSVLLNLTHRLSPVSLRVRFDAARCNCAKGDHGCERACTLGLNPRMAGRGLEWECSVCGDCTSACASRGKALTLGAGPGRKD